MILKAAWVDAVWRGLSKLRPQPKPPEYGVCSSCTHRRKANLGKPGEFDKCMKTKPAPAPVEKKNWVTGEVSVTQKESPEEYCKFKNKGHCRDYTPKN